MIKIPVRGQALQKHFILGNKIKVTPTGEINNKQADLVLAANKLRDELISKGYGNVTKFLYDFNWETEFLRDLSYSILYKGDWFCYIGKIKRDDVFFFSEDEFIK